MKLGWLAGAGGGLLLSSLLALGNAARAQEAGTALDPAWGPFAKVAGRSAVASTGSQLRWHWRTPGRELVQEWVQSDGRLLNRQIITLGPEPDTLLLSLDGKLNKPWLGRVQQDGSVLFVGTGLIKAPHIMRLDEQGVWDERSVKLKDGAIASVGASTLRGAYTLAPASPAAGAATPEVAALAAAEPGVQPRHANADASAPAAQVVPAPSTPAVDPAQAWRAQAEASVAAATRAIEAARARIPESGAGAAPLTASAMLQSAGEFKDWPIVRRLVAGKVWSSSRVWRYSKGAWLPMDGYLAEAFAWGSDGVLENPYFAAPGSKPPAMSRFRQASAMRFVEFSGNDGSAGVLMRRSDTQMVLAFKDADGVEFESHYALVGQSLVVELGRVSQGALVPVLKAQFEAEPEVSFEAVKARVAQRGAELELRLARQHAEEAQRNAEQALAAAQGQASQDEIVVDSAGNAHRVVVEPSGYRRLVPVYQEPAYQEEVYEAPAAPRPNLMEVFSNTFSNEMGKQAAQQAEFQRGLNRAVRAGDAEYQRRMAAERAAEARARQQAQQQQAQEAQRAAEQARQVAEARLRDAEAAAERARRIAEAQPATQSASASPMTFANAGGSSPGAANAGRAMTSDDDAMQCVSTPISVPNTASPKGSTARISNNCAYPVQVRICLRLSQFWDCGSRFGVAPGADWTWSAMQEKFTEAFMDAAPTSNHRPLKHPPPGLPVR